MKEIANKRKVCKNSRSIVMDICLFAKINSLLSQDKTSIKETYRALGFLEGVYHSKTVDKGFSSDNSDEASDGEGCPIKHSLEALYYMDCTATSQHVGRAVGIFLTQKLAERYVDWMCDEAAAQLELTAAFGKWRRRPWSAKEFLDNVIAGHLEESEHVSGQFCHICRDFRMIQRKLSERTV